MEFELGKHLGSANGNFCLISFPCKRRLVMVPSNSFSTGGEEGSTTSKDSGRV